MKNAFGKLSTGIITAAMAAAIILTAKTSAKAAQQIEFNKEYSADLGAGLDYEYKFKAPKTGKYRFYVNNTSNTGRSASFQVYGYKSKKKLDAKNSATLIEGCGNFKSKKISLKKGKKYYIKIEKAHPCNASYDLKIKKVK